MKYIQLTQSDKIQRLRDNYLQTLSAPMDGMWENAIIAHATFWEIQDQQQHIGYFCLNSEHELLRFHLVQNYQSQAQDIFHWLLSTHNIQQAFASTIEPFYFSLCIDLQKSSNVHIHLFRDSKPVEASFSIDQNVFRKAEKSELTTIVCFYQANTEGSGEWIEPFVYDRINRKELFVLWNQQTLIATGECIPSQKQPPYADLGMIVAQGHRGRGIGSAMLTQLKKHCYQASWQPICSCEATNHASKKAIEKAGFISEHSIVKILF